MWTAKLVWKHDCIIGKRCEKFNVEAVGFPIGFYIEKNNIYYSHVQTIKGKKENVDEFIKDLKKDKRINEFENTENILFFSYFISSNTKIPTAHHNQKIFFFKPVYVDNKGYEHWEISSWNKKHINEFIKNTKKEADEFRIISIEKTNLDEIYFPRFIPQLTESQKRAIELAVKNGYYDFPRNIDLKSLSEKMDISLSTYREHLRIAEKKTIPEFISEIEKE
jgi:predicted DNA binding protein